MNPDRAVRIASLPQNPYTYTTVHPASPHNLERDADRHHPPLKEVPMRTLFLRSILFVLVLGSRAMSPAQITIASHDVGAQFVAGHIIVTHVDTSTKNVDIGPLGATSWDFSGLVSNYTTGSQTVRPDTTPFFSEYPTATQAMKIGSLYIYFSLGPDLFQLGSAYSVPFDARIKNNPSAVIYDLPLTYGASWTTSYAETTRISSLSFLSVSDVVVTNTVDAYGSLTLPGGSVTPALRLRIDTRKGTGLAAIRFIQYQYLTTGGATVTVSAKDTLQPSTGTIEVSSATWNGQIFPTGVEELPSGPLPQAFALDQNYPNPFNPSTTIPFSVERAGEVRLVVYDLLGQELEVLVAGEYVPGRYAVRWDASAYPSGVYVCRMRSGERMAARLLLLSR
jgi:hypothetical protein